MSRAPTTNDPPDSSESFTVVAFHAHPDDEALLTGGTLAKMAHEGHRVVLVTATCGERGLAGSADGHGAHLAAVRMAELQRSADALGCARVVALGFADSGLRPDPEHVAAFAHVDVEVAARVLAELLRAEHADVLTIYDANGGYGHPDHVQVHRVGTRAAEMAGTPVVLEATAPDTLFHVVLGVLALTGHALGRSAPLGTFAVFTPRNRITHRICVTSHLTQKRAAMAAHHSQRRAEGRRRVIDRLVGLPRPIFALAFSHEWFVEQHRKPAKPVSDLFASLRSSRVAR